MSDEKPVKRNTLSLMEIHLEKAMRFGLTLREHFHNAFGAGAKNVSVFCYETGGRTFLAVAHDGDPFDDLDHLKDCMGYLTSYGNYGAFGGGMKATMELANNDGKSSDDYALYVFSRDPSDNFIGATGFANSTLNYHVKTMDDLSKHDLLDPIRKNIPTVLKNSRVIYVNLLTAFDKSHQGNPLRGEYFRTASEMISDELIDGFEGDVRFYPRPISKSGNSHSVPFTSHGKMQEQFIIDSETVSTEFEFTKNTGGFRPAHGKYRVELTFGHSVCFAEKSREGTRGIRLNEGVGKAIPHQEEPPVVNLCRYFVDLHKNQTEDDKRRLHRASAEAVWAEKLPTESWRLLSSVEFLPRVTNSDHLTTAWNFVHKSPGKIPIPNPRVSEMSGIITLDARVTRLEDDGRGVVPGGLYPVFISKNKELLQAIVNQAFLSASLEAQPKLQAFIDRTLRFYPKNDQMVVDLPVAETKVLKSTPKPTLDVFDYDINDGSMGAMWGKGKKFKINQTYHVYLCATKGGTPEPVAALETTNLQISILPIEGHPGGYTIKIPKMYKMVSGSNLPQDIDAKEFKRLNGVGVGPQPGLVVRAGHTRWILRNRIDVPACGRARDKNRDFHGGTQTLPDTGWQDMEPGLIGRFIPDIGELRLNKQNVEVLRLFHKELEPKNKGNQNSLYGEMAVVAKRVYQEIMEQFRMVDGHTWPLNASPEASIVNTNLQTVLELSASAKRLRTALSKKGELPVSSDDVIDLLADEDAEVA